MSIQSLFTLINRRWFFLCAFILLFIFAFSRLSFPQNEGISLHGDFLSTVFTYGFNKSFDHPGNFLLGGQYNYPLSTVVELNGGFDFLWVELYGSINNVNKQAEVFIPFIFGGAALNFDRWRIFGKIGFSLDESVNDIGSGKGWTSSILNFYMGSLQLGITYPIYHALSLSTSASYYFGDKIKFESNHLIFSTINLGLSYNLFSSEVVPLVVEKGLDKYKEKYLAVQSENKELYKQIVNLHDRIKKMESSAVVKVDSVPIPVSIDIPVKTISVDSINNVYNLHLREPLNLKDFVDKRGLSEVGKLILIEYNNIATFFDGLQNGIYLVCTVADINSFKKYESGLLRIRFKSDPAVKDKLVIDIDVFKTAAINKVKLEFK